MLLVGLINEFSMYFIRLIIMKENNFQSKDHIQIKLISKFEV